MDLKFYRPTANYIGTPFLTFEGHGEIETVQAAANYAHQSSELSYPGRKLIRNALHNLSSPSIEQMLSRSWQEGRISRVSRYTLNLMRAVEGTTNAGIVHDTFRQLGQECSQEEINHKETPDNQRLKVIEAGAETAMNALRKLANAPPEDFTRNQGHLQAEQSAAQALVNQIDEAYKNPVTLENY